MRKIFLTLTATLLILSGCEKEIEYQNVGVITGPDNRMCACCGGWFIEIDLQSETFPMNVKLNYSLVGCGCLGDEVVIGNMVKN